MARNTLATYRKKRDFGHTPEPPGEVGKGKGGRFVVHEHHASRLHFDLRIEMGGVLKSFAVPKGPSMNPQDRRLAVQTEDHPIQYLRFKGAIEEGQYGAGEMVIWDEGRYETVGGIDPERALGQGKLHFILRGKRLHGEFILVKGGFGGAARDPENRNWLLFKKKDQDAEEDWTPVQVLPYGSRREKPGNAEATFEDVPPAKSSKAAKPAKAARKAKPRPSAIKEWPKAARRAPLPEFVEPMTAKLADAPFSDPEWVFETKWDGWRALLRFDGKEGRLLSRKRKSLDDMFPELKDLSSALRARECLVDGEVVALDSQGVPRFQLLQNRLKGRHASNGEGAMVYYAFDLLHCDGRDLTGCTLLERKTLLRKILAPSEIFRYTDHFPERGEELFEKARRLGFEGVMAKHKDSLYRSGRGAEWLKFKTRRRQEVVIGGYTDPRGGRKLMGALVAGLYDDKGRFSFVGHVGGGFNARLLKEVHELLQPYKSKASPFQPAPKTNEKVQWLRPELVCEVEFAEWTSDGIMRMPVFMGLRPDKDPRECVREKEEAAGDLKREAESEKKSPPPAPRRGGGQRGKAAGRGTAAPGDPEITNPGKVYWPGEGFTKGDLIEYYRAVAPYILPHLQDRPMILRRYPDGIAGPSFYQHDVKKAPPFVALHPIEESAGLVSYVLCKNRETLLWLANLGDIAMHPWLSHVPGIDTPDWIVWDLDPQEGVDFSMVCESALYLKSLCDDLGLKVFAKTSGSRGIHIYLPLKPDYSFAQGLDFAQLIGAHAAREKPGFFTVERSIKERERKRVYLDCMQNSRGKSVAAVYSARAVPGACVSAPLEWAELKKKIRMEDFTLETLPKRLEKKGDLFRDVLKVKNSLSGAIIKLRRRMGGKA
jgi:bifunctional non-homologous end joining protein LigD